MGRNQKPSKKIKLTKAYIRFEKEELIQMIDRKLLGKDKLYLAKLLAEMDGF